MGVEDRCKAVLTGSREVSLEFQISKTLQHGQFALFSMSNFMSKNEYKCSPAFYSLFVVCCAIWYRLYNLKNVKNTHRGVLILVKLQAETCNFTEINTPPWVIFTFFKLYKRYQLAQRITFATITKM